jgi:hypothetical protein
MAGIHYPELTNNDIPLLTGSYHDEWKKPPDPSGADPGMDKLIEDRKGGLVSDCEDIWALSDPDHTLGVPADHADPRGLLAAEVESDPRRVARGPPAGVLTAMDILLDVGQMHYYAAQGYEWDEIKDEIVRAAPPPEPEPEHDDFSQISWLRDAPST